MSTLQRLENISYDDIENKLMLILLANPDITYTKSELYNILLENLESTTQYVHPQFKFKYMVVLNQLPSNHDVKVTDDLVTSGLDIDYSELKNKENVNVDLPNMEELSEFIVENNLLKTTNFNGVPFDLVRNNKLSLVEKMFEEEHMVYFRKTNTENKTPIRYINSQQMTNLFLEKLYLKVIELEKENLEMYGEILKLENVSFYKFFNRKIQNYILKNNIDIVNISSITLSILLLMLNEKSLKLLIFLNLVFCCVGLVNSKIFSK